MPLGEALGWVMKQREVHCGQALLLGFLQERKSKAGPADLGLANLDNFSRLWAIRAVRNCLLPGPGMIRDLKYESLIREVVGSVDLFGCSGRGTD